AVQSAPMVSETPERIPMPAVATDLGHPTRAPSVTSAHTTARHSRPISWPLLLFFVWLTGALALGMHVLVAAARLARRLRGLPEVSDPKILAVLEDCRQRMQVRSQLRLVEGAEVPSPALHGVFKPRLLLPAGFTSAFSLAELHFVFLHELAHVKRRDA